MSGINIDTVLEPLQGMITTLQGSKAAREKYGQELGKKIGEVEAAIGLLQNITTGVNKLKTDIKDGQDSIAAANAAGNKKVADEIARVKDEAKAAAADAAKVAGDNVAAAKQEAIDKIKPLIDAITQQKENIEGAIGDLNNVGFTQTMDGVVKAINELNKIFQTDGPGTPGSGSGSGSVSSRASALESTSQAQPGTETDSNIHKDKTGIPNWHRVKNTPPKTGFYYYKTDGDQQTDGMNLNDPRIPKKIREAEQDYLKKTSQVLAAFQGGRRTRRRRRRGGFRYGVPKSALPRTLRSILSAKTKSTKKSSAKGKKGKRTKRRKRKRKRRR